MGGGGDAFTKCPIVASASVVAPGPVFTRAAEIRRVRRLTRRNKARGRREHIWKGTSGTDTSVWKVRVTFPFSLQHHNSVFIVIGVMLRLISASWKPFASGLMGSCLFKQLMPQLCSCVQRAEIHDIHDIKLSALKVKHAARA